MKTNDLKKGMRIRLRNGWYGTMYDNAKGNTRMAQVEGYECEIGSVYSHDIMAVLVDNQWVDVNHTPPQTKLRGIVEGMYA